ncbi:S8 family peptidase [Planotetraspora sp. A-T 1434]|uniref:S8 family peptidase n=1 Tax=Planotetraspora sp. A-T 1434 TaxID=2979219 RepID=UPI0021BEDA3C|nr:S8 family peptidase [Planotetraspora sp. A-T 1434]MCT9932803.1 S8 family peptidase [Planotetraspora sp. A-T 1434]
MTHPPMSRTPLRWAALLVAAVAPALATVLATGPAAHADDPPAPTPAQGTVLAEASDPADLIPGSYIVVLKNGADVDAAARTLTGRHGGRFGRTYHFALRGFAVRASAAEAKKLAADPAVAYVQQNSVVRASDTQPSPPSWGLDRIDQRNLPLSSSYTYGPTGAGVHAYIVDTGIRTTHSDFGGRASIGFDAIGDGQNGQDCNGHGTHVAGTTGGGSYGVAKGVLLVAVRVLDCDGSGTTDQVIAGIDWVTAHAVKPAVANMSLGGSANTALDDAVRRSVASGVGYAIAAGNGFLGLFAQNACSTSPARVPEAITVSITDISDKKPSWGNIGTCVDLFAPGYNITSAWKDSDTSTNTISGTSMSTPHVTGAAALYLQGHPTATPQQVRDAIVNNATTGVVVSPGSGSPNRLLYTAGL